jgi:hypothetical protein
MVSLGQLVARFESDPAIASRMMRDLLRDDSANFITSAIALLRRTPDSPGLDFVVALLCGNDLAVSLFADPGVFTDAEAIAVVRRLVRADPSFDLRLLQFAVVGEGGRAAGTPAVRRILQVLAAVSDMHRAAPRLMLLLRHPDENVRSRAALLLGSTTRDCAWACEQLRAEDPRVRANVVESLWGTTSVAAQRLFRAAANDPHNRVAGNALLGLYRCGAAESIRLITEMAGSQSSAFRSTAAWVMGQTGDPRFVQVLNRVPVNSSSGERRSVLRALDALGRRRPARERLGITASPEPQDRFTIDVRDSLLRPVRELPGTAFICWSGDMSVDDYEVTPVRQREGRYLLRAAFQPGSVWWVVVRTEMASGSASLTAVPAEMVDDSALSGPRR